MATVAATIGATLEHELREAVAQQVGPAKFGLWFGEGVRLGVDGDSLQVGVPNAFFRDWIRGHFAGDLAHAAEAVAGRSLRVAYRIDDEAAPRVGEVIGPVEPGSGRPKAPTVPIPQAPPTPSPTPPDPTRTLNHLTPRPIKRLETFVVGPGNRLAHAAAIEVASRRGAGFNPLVLHGAVGLGKTHLLEGIAQALRAHHPGIHVVLITAEAFTNGFLEAMRTGTLPAFRARYRKVDALLVDDIHFLAAKRATQDEFLHTFNALVAAGAPIVLACDHHPRRVAKLSDELSTRFLGGMVVKVEPPDAATRKAILLAKAEARGVDIPEAVLAYVAEHLRGSVRELEGALHSLVAHALLVGRRLDLATAKLALRDTIRHTAQAVGLRDVEHAVCEAFHLDPEVLKSDGRARAVAYPRMMAMYLARKHAGAAYSEIGRYFGGRNHSTVIAAEKKVAAWLQDQGRNPLLAGFETAADCLAALESAIGA